MKVEDLAGMQRTKRVAIGILLCWVSMLCCSCFGIAGAELIPWDCPECGRTGNKKNYCGGCGKEAPWIRTESWDCRKCGRKGNRENYCANCGQAAQWIEDASGKLSREDFSKVGNIVRFGHYEQDNDLDNGQEEIEWIVLDVQEGKSLLISKYGLDAKPYNTSYASVTWETCTLRNWLNSDFLKAAFTAQEQSAMLATKVDNSKNQGYGVNKTTGGKNTQDQIFLLSYHEAFDLYFKNDDTRECAPTKYTEAQGAFISSTNKVNGRGAGWWWLRSPGNYQNVAATVDSGGARGNSGVSNASGCIRPAFWINLESDLF